MSDTATKLRLSISRKNKQTNEYETDFSGFVMAVGSATAKRAAALKEGDRIKMGDCDVTTKYDKARKVQYTNFVMFNFDMDEGGGSGGHHTTDPQPTVDEGVIDDSGSGLPF